MKAVPRLAAEPALLHSYCQNNPTEAASSGDAASAAWERFRSDPAYHDLVSRLATVQGALCAYCEQRVTHEYGDMVFADYQVEHVLPKSKGTGRVLDWKNLVLACGGGSWPHHRETSRKRAGKTNESCGQWKDQDELDTRCDPRTFPCQPRLVEVGLNGEIGADASACAANGINPSDLNHTINNVLNLNCERLKTKREKIADNVRGWIVPILREQLANEHLTQNQRALLEDLTVAGRLQPDGHGFLRAFWTTERQYLAPWAEPWLTANANLFHCPPAAPPNQGGTP